jgi:hypothetical protein
MKNHGEIVENAVRASGVTIANLSKKMNVTRQTIYNLFKSSVISWERLDEIGRIINYDFSKDIRSARIKPYANYESERPAQFRDSADEINYWRNKYIELLEKYNMLLESSGDNV